MIQQTAELGILQVSVELLSEGNRLYTITRPSIARKR